MATITDPLSLKIQALQNQYQKAMATAWKNPTPQNMAAAAATQQKIADIQKANYGANLAQQTSYQNTAASETAAAVAPTNQAATLNAQANAALASAAAAFNRQFGTNISSAADVGHFAAIWNGKNSGFVPALESGYNTYLLDSTAANQQSAYAQADRDAATAATNTANIYGGYATTARKGELQSEATEGFVTGVGSKIQGEETAASQLAAQTLAQQQKDAAAAASYQTAAGGQQATGSPSFDLAGSKKSTTAASGAAPSGAPSAPSLGGLAAGANLPSNSKTVFNAPVLTGFQFGGG